MELSIVTLGFVAGAVATVNPCGFALLPAFASFVLGESGGGQAGSVPVRLRLWRALRLGGVVTVAFVAVFAATGLVFAYISSAVVAVVPWLALAVGVLLAGYGLLVAAGRGRWRMRLPNPAEGRTETTSGFVFGVGYAIASLSCTLPVFLTVVAGTLTTTGLAAGVAGFVAYGAGMGTIVFAVAISMALARDGLVARLRRAGRHLERLAGAVLAAAGGYVVVYWTYGLGAGRQPTADSTAPAPIRAVTGLADTAGRYLDSPAGQTTVVVLAGLVAAAALAGLLARRRHTAAPQPPDPGRDDTDGPTSGPAQPETARARADQPASGLQPGSRPGA